MSSDWIQVLVSRLGLWMPVELARVAIAMAIVLFGYLLALLVRTLVGRIFRTAGAHLVSLSRRTSESSGVSVSVEATEKAHATAIQFAKQVAFWLVFTLFLGAGTAVLGFPVLSSWLESLASYLPRVLASIAILLLGVLSGFFIRILVMTAASAAHPHLARTLGIAAQVAVVILAGAMAIEELGIEVTFLIVAAAVILGCSLGGAALAFGLGARQSVGNMLAAHYVAKWYRGGERIEIDGYKGTIIEILPGAVVLQTDSGKLYIPAHTFAEKPSLLVLDEDEI